MIIGWLNERVQIILYNLNIRTPIFLVAFKGMQIMKYIYLCMQHFEILIMSVQFKESSTKVQSCILLTRWISPFKIQNEPLCFYLENS